MPLGEMVACVLFLSCVQMQVLKSSSEATIRKKLYKRISSQLLLYISIDTNGKSLDCLVTCITDIVLILLRLLCLLQHYSPILAD